MLQGFGAIISSRDERKKFHQVVNRYPRAAAKRAGGVVDYVGFDAPQYIQGGMNEPGYVFSLDGL